MAHSDEMSDVHHLRAIIDAQSALAAASTGSDGGVMDLAATHARELTGADAAIVELAEGDEMVYRAATGTAAAHLGLRLGLHASLSGMCVRTGEVLVCADTEDDDRVDRDACRAVGARSMAVTPLFHDGAAIGVLKVMSSAPDAFPPAAVETLQLLATSVSAAIKGSRDRVDDRFRATHDPLTGLGNRALLGDALAAALAHAARHGQAVGVLYCDLDRFKPVNDQHGHEVGDDVLCKVASRLRSQCRAEDTVARVGGDEFVVVAELADAAQVEHLAARIEDAVRQPITVGAADVEVTVGISIGIATAFGPEPVDTLLARADAAMYATKRAR